MKIDLKTISFAEILAEVGKKRLSGCLSVDIAEQENRVCIWCWEGNIVSVTGNNSITTKVVLYEWINLRLTPAVIEESINKPIGEKLTNVYGISPEKINQLFEEQIAEITLLFSAEQGTVIFEKIEDRKHLPWKEMTGRKITALTVVKHGLTNNFGERHLNDLPESTLALKLTDNDIEVELDDLEKKILKQATKNQTIDKIAKTLQESRFKIQKKVYILDLIGVVEKTLISSRFLELTENLVLQKNKEGEIDLSHKNWRKPLLVIASCNLVIILGLFIGLFQDLERGMLDRFFRWRGTAKNSKITLITISDTDINKIQSYPIPDRNLAQTIKNIKQYNPSVIGIDLYRDIPQNPGHEELLSVYRSTPNLIGVEKIVGNKVLPPPVLSKQQQVGFSDLIIDNDGVLRRALMSLNNNDQYRLSLGTYLALFFLDSKGVQMSQTAPDRYSIGKVTLESISSSSGGYWREDLGGVQILLNYQSQLEDFEQISFWDAYNNRINPQLITDRIVIIGTIADSKKDYVTSPYTRQARSRKVTPGVVIHANVAAQLVDAVLEDRPLLKINSKGQEILWILLWSIVGIIIGIAVLEINFNFSEQNQDNQFLIFVLNLTGLFLFAIAISYIAFLNGWWIPTLTPFLAALISFNITSLQYQKELKKLIYVDRATKVFNRHYFKKILDKDFAEAKNKKTNLTLAFFRFDSLEKSRKRDSKQIFNNYLAIIARQINQTIIQKKFVARYDFNTLAVLLPDTDLQEAEIIVTTISNLIERELKSLPKNNKTSLLKIDYKIGFATITDQIGFPIELIAVAAPY